MVAEGYGASKSTAARSSGAGVGPQRLWITRLSASSSCRGPRCRVIRAAATHSAP